MLIIEAQRCATATQTGCSTIEGVANMTINGTIRVVPARFCNLQVGDSIRIFTANVFSGTPQIAAEGPYEWDASRISEGLLFVKNIDTGIDSVISAETPRNIYDTRGRLVRANATNTEGLPAGIYVCEGRKFVVRP